MRARSKALGSPQGHPPSTVETLTTVVRFVLEAKEGMSQSLQYRCKPAQNP